MIITAKESHKSTPKGYLWQGRKPYSIWNSIALLFTAFSLLAISVIGQAATIKVNSTADNQFAGNGSCTLREAVDNANSNTDGTLGDCSAGTGNDKVKLPEGDFDITGELTITDDVTLMGKNATSTRIDANQSGRVFRIVGAINAAFGKLTITGGSSANGGGIAVPVGAAVLVRQSVITDNTAGGIGGGGIFNQGTVITHDTDFTDNEVTGIGAGGAIRNEGAGAVLTVIGSTFDGNKTALLASGGAIVNHNGNVMITTSSFTNNEVPSGNGGAVENGGNMVIEKSDFDSNSVGKHGGAVRNSKSLVISKSSFTNNTANNGGAVYNQGTMSLFVEKTEITGNTANTNGGGIFNVGANVTVDKSNVTMNTAIAGNGGGVHDNGIAVFTKSDISNNTPDDCFGCL